MPVVFRVSVPEFLLRSPLTGSHGIDRFGKLDVCGFLSLLEPLLVPSNLALGVDHDHGACAKETVLPEWHAVARRNSPVSVCGQQEGKVVVGSPGCKFLRGVRTDSNQNYVFAAVEDQWVLITVPMKLDSSATGPGTEEER